MVEVSNAPLFLYNFCGICAPLFPCKTNNISSLHQRKLDTNTQFLLQQPSVNSLKQQVWKVATTNKIHHSLWQSLSGVLEVNERLGHRHLRIERCCPKCSHPEETINHAIFTCQPALNVGRFRISQTPQISFRARISGRMWITYCRVYPLERLRRSRPGISMDYVVYMESMK